jgi:hypothetical protein
MLRKSDADCTELAVGLPSAHDPGAGSARYPLRSDPEVGRDADHLAGSVVRNRSAPVDAKDRHRFVGQIVSQRARAGSVDGRNSV